ncbi:MAG: MFS transporter [Jatrophihabitans sp.]
MAVVPASGQAGVLRQRNFRRFYLGYSTSLFGTGMEPIGVAFAVLATGGSAADLGFVLTGGVVANVLCLAAGGVVADRFGRRVVMLVSDTVRCLAEAGFAGLVLFGHPAIWTLFLLYALQYTGTGFFTPALLGLTPDIVSAEDLHQANVLNGLARDVGRVFGPAIAGLLVAASSPGVVLAIDAGTYAISVASLASLRIPAYSRQTGRSLLGDLRDGWGAWRAQRWIWVTSVKFALFNAVVLAPYLVLGPVVAKHHLGGSGSWGLILAAQGVGSVVAGPLIIRWRPARPLAVITVVQLAWALPVLCLALLLPVPVIAVAAFFAGLGSASFNAIWTTTLQRNVPTELMARVNSLDFLFSYALAPVGLVLAAAVSQQIGTTSVLLTGAGWQVVSTLAVLALPVVRQFRADPEPISQPVDNGGGRHRAEM